MALEDSFDFAAALHEAGRSAEAEAVCRQIVAADPRHSSAWLMLGIIRAEFGAAAEALQLVSQSLAISPDVPLGQFYLGMLQAQIGRAAEALASYGRAVELDAEFAEAHYGRGHLFFAANRFEEALAAFEHTARLRPDFPDARCATAVVLSRLNRPDEALAALDAVLKQQDDFVPALNMRSDLACERGAYEQALADSARSLALAPNQSAAHVSRCTAFLALHRYAEAQAEVDLALALEPNAIRAIALRAVLHREAGRLEDALKDCDLAVALAPNDAVVHLNRGDTLLTMGRNDEALVSLNRAVACNPRLVKNFASRALALRHLKRYDEALADCDRALALDASLGPVAAERFLLAGLTCDWRERDSHIADLERRVRAGDLVSPWVVVTAIDDPALQLAAARRATDPVAEAPRTPPPHRRLRVAYLSPDFHEHPTAHLMVELIERHDRSQFEMFGICLRDGSASAIRERVMQGFEHFVEAGALSDAGVADWLRSNEIDIAVDLAGHAGGARPRIYLQKPAPLIVNFAGHPGTLGANWADYILADDIVIPPGGEQHFSECVVRLPNCYLPNDTRYEIDPAPSRAAAGLPEQGFVFSSFNSSYKITPFLFDIWMRLLREVPGSVLWLLAEDAAVRRNLTAEAEARGVPPERLVFAGRLPRAQYLGRLKLADCFLDALPCNAHTTCSDALWMGLPVVTCMGRSFAARVAGSMLTALGMPELIAADLADYEAIALSLAQDPVRLRSVREKLAAHRASHPLFDIARMARNVEQAYRIMWQHHTAGLPPAGFSVCG